MRWLALLLCLCPLLATADPRFDPTALLKEVLVPADVAVGSVVYRLRALDTAFDYPLVFTLRGVQRVVAVQELNCTRFNSVCQANVILKKRLEAGRYYDFTVDIRNQRGDRTSLNCSFRATNATTPTEKIFPGAPTLLTVSENARRNTELGKILAKGNPNRMKPVLLELWGSPQFGLHQKLITDRDAEGTILLLGPLDYETKTVHHLTVLANDPWTNMEEDTRNIAGWPLLVAVLDEQDTPPIFTIAPPTTTLSPTLNPGDLILRVHAEDGDKGNPRDIRYGLVPNGELSSRFFNIDEDSGELTLARPLSEILSYSNTGQPILVTVVADEVRSKPQEAPAQSTSVQLALIPPGVTAGLPTFGSIEYHALLDENSPTGTALELPQAEVSTQPGDVVTLELYNNNGTFDISPSVVEGFSRFTITVHDNSLLDYEARRSVVCYIVAKEFAKGNYSARAKLTVILNDVNDNHPQFVYEEFQGNVQENAPAGTTVLVVEATDVDNGLGGKIKYTQLTGDGRELFMLDPKTGLITVANSNGLDADTSPVINLVVEAADENGNGLSTTANVKINLIDINDNAPQFEKEIYEFILNLDGTSFTSPAFIKAIDADISSPNNEIHYELINAPSNFFVNELTGELLVKQIWESPDVTVLRARAWDGGVPRLSGECEIRIYPKEGQTQKLVFIVPGRNPEKDDVAKTLRTLTGGRVKIHKIRPYTGRESELTYVAKDDKERSVVEATITYSKGSVIDLHKIQQILDNEHAVIQQTGQTVTKSEKETIIKQSSGGDLLWLLILLIVLAILAVIILILCCICRPCPLYIPPKRRKIKSAEAVEKFVVKCSGEGRESKSVQVAEWFGRKEAWSADREAAAVMIDHEVESLRRHEMERGSDRGGARRSLHRLERQAAPQQMAQDPTREQLYIREGNADILRLITRGGDQQQRPVTLMEQQYLVDSGKDILMKRFIDQQQMQQAEAARTQILLPNAVSRLQSEHDLMEASLRQQNAILRQLILERERDIRLETQSLPAGTQTDQDAGTQTEPQYLRPPRRKVQSDNDASDQSDEELAIIKARAKRRNRNHVKRNIKTPIQEETELEMFERPHKAKAERVESSKPRIKHTRTSELRQQRASSEARSSRSKSSRSGLHKDVLREISASLERSDESDTAYFNQEETPRELYSEDSLEEISPRSDKTTDSGKHKYHSESDLRLISSQKTSSESPKEKSQSHSDLRQVKRVGKANKQAVKKSSRYMEWYTKNKPVSKKDAKAEEKIVKGNNISASAKLVKTDSSASRLMRHTESSSRKKSAKKKLIIGPEHPLLQHSEHRYESQYSVRRPDEDTDSGIVLTKPEMAQKKSVFTIAYNDIHTRQLRADSSTTP